MKRDRAVQSCSGRQAKSLPAFHSRSLPWMKFCTDYSIFQDVARVRYYFNVDPEDGMLTGLLKLREDSLPHVEFVSVHFAYEGRGIGKSLMLAAMKDLARRGASSFSGSFTDMGQQRLASFIERVGRRYQVSMLDRLN